MDWVTGIQRALDYTETHLTEEIDYEAVAKQAYSSPFHFQRMFGMLCGFSLGDYIRMRRLTLAAEELVRTRGKVKAFPARLCAFTESRPRRRGGAKRSNLFPDFP